MADFPTLFSEDRQPETNYILIPLHSSEKRIYILFGVFSKDDIVGNSCSFIPEASLYTFGVLQSRMHMAWVRFVTGRIKSDLRYSGTIVYNNFPWSGIDGEISNKQELKNDKTLASRLEH